MKLRECEAKIEAILFACGDSVEISRLCEAAGLSFEQAEEALSALERNYREEDRGIRLIRLEGSVQLVSAPEYHDAVSVAARLTPRTELSPAAMEVLSIVAYNQPVTKFAVEKLRGADSSYQLARLVRAGLLQEAGRLSIPGRPILYKTTEAFLRCFSISSLDELPDIAPPDDGADDE